MVFQMTLQGAEDGRIVAECSALPGCISQGMAQKEVLDNIKKPIIAPSAFLSTLTRASRQEYAPERI